MDIKKIWIAQQEQASPRYSMMSANQKIAFDAQLSDYYDQNQKTFIIKYGDNFLNTRVTNDVTDDSNRVPFGTPQQGVNLGTGIVTTPPQSPDFIPLFDNINDRILWVDKLLQNLFEVWIFDKSPSDLSAINLVRFFIGQQINPERIQPIPNIDNLNNLIALNGYLVDNVSDIKRFWVPVFNPLDIYLSWERGSKGWTCKYDIATLSGNITKNQLLKNLSDELWDPLHPEQINPTWIYEKSLTTYTNPFEFTYEKGPIISDIKLNILFIGGIEDKEKILKFHKDLFEYIPTFNLLKQYGINSGRVISSSEAGETNQIRQHLQDQIDAGNLSQPDNSTFYLIYVNSELTNYHDYFTAKNGYNCRYGVVKATDLQNTTINGSRILFNGVTDPERNGWVATNKELCDFDGSGPIGDWYISTIYNSATRGVATGNGTPILFPIYQPGLVYHGGPVVANFEIVKVMIGDIWPSKSLETVTGQPDYPLPDYLNFLCKDGKTFLNILRQYGILSGQVETTKYITGVSLTQTKENIKALLQNNITDGNLPEPDGNKIYLCFLDGNINMGDELGRLWDINDPFYFDVAVYYTDHFTTIGGNTFRFGVEKLMDETFNNPDRNFAPQLTRMLANLVTNPDGNGWYTIDSGREVGNIDSTNADDNFTPLPGDEPVLASLWDQHSRGSKFIQTVPILNNDPLIKYHGGAIVKTPNIFVIFIGTLTGFDLSDIIYYFQILLSTEHIESGVLNTESTFFRNAFYYHLYMNVLRQYGIVGGSVHSTPIVISASGIKTEADIQIILQNAINGNVIPEPDKNNIYLCYVDQMSFGGIWASNVPVGAETIGHFKSSAGNSVRYAIIKNINPTSIPDDISLQKVRYAGWLSTAYATKTFANLITNPDGDGWFSDAGLMVSDYDSGVFFNGILIVSDVSEWPLWRVYDDYNQGNNYGWLDPVDKVKMLDDTQPIVITDYYWRMTELEPFDNTFRLKITKDYDTQNNSISWNSYGLIKGIGVDEWRTKFIEPLAGKISIPGSDKVTLDEIIKSFPQEKSLYEVNIISNNGVIAILETIDHWVNKTSYFLYYNDSNDGWVFINIIDPGVSNDKISEMIRLRPGLYHQNVIWNGTSFDQVELLTKDTPDLLEPDPFYPGIYYVVGNYWVEKSSPWTFRTFGLDILTLFFNAFNIYSTPRDPFAWEINDPSLMNSQWSIESVNGITGVVTWQFGNYISDINYKLYLKNSLIVGYQHTDLDGIVRHVDVNWTKSETGILKSVTIPLVKESQDYLFNTYTTGGHIKQIPGIANGEPFLVSGLGSRQGVFQEAYSFVADVIAAFSFQGIFKVIDQHVVDVDTPSVGDYVLMEGIEKTNQKTIRIYHEWVPEGKWYSLSNQENEVGGFFLTKIYLP